MRQPQSQLHKRPAGVPESDTVVVVRQGLRASAKTETIRRFEGEEVQIWGLSRGSTSTHAIYPHHSTITANAQIPARQASISPKQVAEPLRQRGGGVGWGAGGSVQAAAGRIGTGGGARADGTFGDGSVGCWAAE